MLHTRAKTPRMGPGTPTIDGGLKNCAALGPCMLVDKFVTWGPAKLKAPAMVLRVVIALKSPNTTPKAKPPLPHPSAGVGMECRR